MNSDEIWALIRRGGSFSSGFMIGYELCKQGAPSIGEVYIFGFRIHHYLMGFLTLFTESDFLRGILAGCATEDLPDLIDDLSSGENDIRKLSDGLRKEQGKPTKWGF